jgi:putative transposase
MLTIEALHSVIERMHYSPEVMLVCVRWYAAYPLGVRPIDEILAARGVLVDDATVHRWTIKNLPIGRGLPPAEAPGGSDWRVDERGFCCSKAVRYVVRNDTND